MAQRLKTPQGKKLYALRKHTPEPVFGIIKSALGFRRFLLRGLEPRRPKVMSRCGLYLSPAGRRLKNRFAAPLLHLSCTRTSSTRPWWSTARQR
jgi:hypothetical protein